MILLDPALFRTAVIPAQIIHTCTSLGSKVAMDRAARDQAQIALPGSLINADFIFIGPKPNSYLVATSTHQWALSKGHPSATHPRIASNVEYSLRTVGKRSSKVLIIGSTQPPNDRTMEWLWTNLWEHDNINRILNHLGQEPLKAPVFDPFDL